MPAVTSAIVKEQMHSVGVRLQVDRIQGLLDKMRPYAHLLTDVGGELVQTIGNDPYYIIVDSSGKRPALVYRSDGHLYLLHVMQRQGRKSSAFQYISLAAVLTEYHYDFDQVRSGLRGVVGALDWFWEHISQHWRQEIGSW